MTATAVLGRGERLDHARARLGFDRMGHRVAPGLYAVGSPVPASPVLVTANYTLSFDALRSSLEGVDAYILVLDTRGVNVWCAAAKGTFATDELVRAVEGTGLAGKVDHRLLVLPQLGAPGVSAREVWERCKFKVEFGPVRSSDLPAFLENGECTEEMRTVRFGLGDRLVLAPVELRNHRWSLLLLAAGAMLIPFYGLMALAVTLGGLFLFPALLPWLPGRRLTVKGLSLGALLTAPFAVHQLMSGIDPFTTLLVLAEVLLMSSWAGYLGLNFTGSTPFTSRSGVRSEIFTFVPTMAIMAAAGAAMAVTAAAGSLAGWF